MNRVLTLGTFALLVAPASAFFNGAFSLHQCVAFTQTLPLTPPISNSNVHLARTLNVVSSRAPGKGNRRSGRTFATLRAVPTGENIASLLTTPAFESGTNSYAPISVSLQAIAATASATFTYLFLLAAYDRPRGSLAPPAATALRVGPSRVAGLGVFALRSLPTGTVLGTYPGVLRPAQAFYDGKCRRFPAAVGYSWRFTDSRYVLDPTDGRGEIQDVCYGGTSGVPFSEAVFGTLLRFLSVDTVLCRINEPPIGAGGCSVGARENLETRSVVFTLVQDVYEGQELYLDYGLDYDRTSYGPNPVVDAVVEDDDSRW